MAALLACSCPKECSWPTNRFRDGTGTDPYFIVLFLALIGLPTLALVLVVSWLRMPVAAVTAVVVATLGAVAWGALLQML